MVPLLSLRLPSGCGLPQVWMHLRTMMFSPENNSREPHLPFGTNNGCPHWAPSVKFKAGIFYSTLVPKDPASHLSQEP